MGDTGCLAPTIQRLLMECDTLINVVTTTCLMTPSMMAQERARVVEFWIWVAMVCRGTAPGVHPGILETAPLRCPLLRMGSYGLPCTVPGPSCQGCVDLDSQAPGVGQPSQAPSLG